MLAVLWTAATEFHPAFHPIHQHSSRPKAWRITLGLGILRTTWL